MPELERIKRILALALPIIGGMLSQNVLNLVDTLMVGVLGDAALAAVGASSFALFMCTAFITSVSVGVQAIAARRMGAGRSEEAAVPLNGGLLVTLLIGLPLTVVLYWLAPYGYPLVVQDEAVAALGVPYLQLSVLSVVALGANFSFRGYYNGVGLSRVYFRTIVVMHITNALLDYMLIFGKFGAPEMGVRGAAIASTVALYLGTVLYVVQALRIAREHGFLARMPSRESLFNILKISIPTSVQQTFFAGGMTVFFAILSRVGAAEAAATTVLVRLLLVVILPSIGFGLASATLVGQALGRRDLDDARRWGTEVVQVAFVMMSLLGLIGVVAPHLLLEPFLHDESTLALAEFPLRVIALSLPFDAVGLVLMHSLIGAGYTRRVMLVGVGVQWGLQLPFIYLAALVFHQSLAVIWLAHFAARALQTAIFAREWRGKGWTRVSV